MPEYQGWKKPTKRGPGRPPKKKEEEHVIHSDGTYSNTGTTKTKKEKLEDTLKEREIVAMSGKRWLTKRRKDWGMYMVQLPYTREPGLQDCKFFTWAQLEEDKATKA